MGSTNKNKININLAIGQSYERQNGGAELVDSHGFNALDGCREVGAVVLLALEAKGVQDVSHVTGYYVLARDRHRARLRLELDIRAQKLPVFDLGITKIKA